MPTTPLFVQARKTTLLVGISAAETGAIVLKNLLDAYGNQLQMADFGSIMYLTLDPGGASEEIISVTDFTVNADNTVTLDTGITRALLADYPYGAGGIASTHSAGITVVASNNPQLYQAIIDYINNIAISGAPNASSTTKGIVQIATTAQIDAGTATGSTGAPIAITPDQLALSQIGENTPTANEKSFLDAIVGIPLPFPGKIAPTGFVLEDGAAYNNNLYPGLLAVCLGQNGYGTGIVFTAVAATDVITAVNHGFSNGDRILVDSAGTLPGGLANQTVYYVISATTNTFKLSTSSGGSAVNITDTGTGVHGAYSQFRVPDMRGASIIGAGTRTAALAYDSTIQTETNPALGQVIIPTSGASISSVSGNIIQTSAAHGLSNGDPIYFTGTPPTGLTANTGYFTIVSDSTHILVASTYENAIAGTAISLSSTTTGAALFACGYFNAPVNPPGWITSGVAVALTSSGSAPTGLTVGAYFAIVYASHLSRIYLASTALDGYKGNAVAITGAGSGIQTLTATLTARTAGATGGEEKHRLTLDESPTHIHTFTTFTGTVTNNGLPAGANGASGTGASVTAAGGDNTHNIMSPWIAMNWITKTG